MARQRASIPILGIDERPNERQKTPGIASELENLRPTGLKEEPEWIPVESPDDLENSDGVAYESSFAIDRMYWHVRGRIGKHGDDAGSLRRLVVLEGDTVKVIDPKIGANDWYEVASYPISSTDSGSWDMYLSQMYDIGYITVTKGGVPQVDLILEDDLLIEFDFPELPAINSFTGRTEDKYSDTQVDGGDYMGFANPGAVYIRYAYRLRSGALVMHSLPEQLIIGTRIGEFNSTITHCFLGYDVEPYNFEFWKDKIAGISILCSEFEAEGTSYSLFDRNTQMNRLENTLWYEVGSFDFIDEEEVEDQQKVIVNSFSEDTLSTNLVADVDDNTHHSKRHGVSIVYNSRLILGGERTVFGRPVISNKEAGNKMGIYCFDGQTWQGSLGAQDKFPRAIKIIRDFNLMGGLASITNKVGVDFVYLGDGTYAIDSETSGWSCKVKFGSYGSIYLTQEMFNDHEDQFISHTTTGAVVQNMRIEVDLDTDSGLLTRVSTETEKLSFYRSPYTTRDGSALYAWLPTGSVVGYPDIRAKQLRIYLYNSGAQEWRLSNTFNLRPAKKANYAVSYRDWIDMFSSATEIGSSEVVSEYTPNKAVASVINSPFTFESDLVYNIGRSSEAITSFAVNALALSEGQYGQYPLYVFKREGIWAMEQSQSADVVFARITPVDVSLGAENEKKVINIGQSIAFANNDGVYLLERGRPQKISDPIKSVIPNIKNLAYLRTDDNEELIVNAGSVAYRYSLKYGRWYMVSLDVNQTVESVFTDNEKLYALYSELPGVPVYRVKDFQNAVDEAVEWRVLLEDIHFGLPDILKRFYLFYLRATFPNYPPTGADPAPDERLTSFSVTMNGNVFTQLLKQVRPKYRSVYDCDIEITGKGKHSNTAIHKIDSEFTPRYPRKQRS